MVRGQWHQHLTKEQSCYIRFQLIYNNNAQHHQILFFIYGCSMSIILLRRIFTGPFPLNFFASPS